MLTWVGICLLFTQLVGQQISGSQSEKMTISMEPALWEFAPNGVKFEDHLSVPSLQIVSDTTKAVLKGVNFTTGTIEFDMAITDYPSIMKSPFGRCDIENTSFELPLREGINELVIGVENVFYGWGVIARLDQLKDITLE